jgi:hypothetical protein
VQRPEISRQTGRRPRFIAASIVALAALVAVSPSLFARELETRTFTASLRGEPQVGCIVTTGRERCRAEEVRGTVVADGSPAFSGAFVFELPGLRGGRAPIGQRGRGKVAGTFLVPGDAEPVRCVFKGRLRTQGVAIPGGASAQRFHAGRFDARGRCGGAPALLNAIWSGSIGNTDGAFVASYERFDGRLAGSIRMQSGTNEVVFRLP